MKKVGIIGGLSPESTVKYYEWLNEGVRQHLGGHHSAKVLLASVDFGEFVNLKEKGDWDTQAELLCLEAKALEKAGADFVILATNTMHKMADQVQTAIQIPFLHIVDGTAEKILEQGITTVGLLGTRYTMELDFYKQRLLDKGIQSIVPNDQERIIVNDIIYNELCDGKISQDSKKKYQQVIRGLIEQGAQGIILGCTEITMLVRSEDSEVPLFDTTAIHVEKTLDMIFASPKSD